MRKKTLLILTAVITLSLSMLVGCGNQQETNSTPTEAPTSTETPTPTSTETPTPTPTETPTPIPTEPSHEHSYTEVEGSEVAATCTTDGKKADKICECGDKVKGEVVKATGHTYGEYKSDGNATYDADGTKTAECSVCGEKDTVTDAGSKLERPKEPNMHGLKFDSVSWPTHYSMVDTNVYFEPSFQGTVIGHLSINDIVKVTGYSNNADAIYNYPPYSGNENPTDIRWKRIDYNGQTGYIPYNYTAKSKRDISVSLHPLAANYPTVDGGGSGMVNPANDGKLYYVYGACEPCTVKLNPECKSLRIYDANLNLIAEVTDQNVSFVMSGNAYCSWGTENHYDWRYEINYNGTIAYVNSLDGIYE